MGIIFPLVLMAVYSLHSSYLGFAQSAILSDRFELIVSMT